MICLRARKIGSCVRDLGRRKQDLLIPVSLEVQRGSSIESGDIATVVQVWLLFNPCDHVVYVCTNDQRLELTTRRVLGYVNTGMELALG